MGFTEVDLDGDFDPKAYDAAMQKVFTDDYYSTQQDEEKKPVFSDSGEEGQCWGLLLPFLIVCGHDLVAVSDDPVDWDQWQPGDGGAGEGEGLHCEDPNFNVSVFSFSSTFDLTLVPWSLAPPALRWTPTTGPLWTKESPPGDARGAPS